VKYLTRERLRRMAARERLSAAAWLDRLVEREWRRLGGGEITRPAPVLPVPGGLQFGPDYRATLRELRAVFGESVEMGDALRERGCERTAVWRSGRACAGWAGVRVVG
jgi:hypothetical protein